MKPIQKPIQKPINKKNAYSVKLGDITIRGEGCQSLKSIRNRVLNDAIALLAKREYLMLNNEIDIDDDEEEDQQELLKQRIKHDIMFQ